MSELVLPFTITAAQINSFDATGSGVNDVGIALDYNFPVNSQAVRVPTRLELIKASGTAYSLTTAISGSYGLSEGEYDVENTSRGGGAYLEVYESWDSFGDRVWFRVPALGFLNSSAQQLRLVFPCLTGAVLNPGATSIKFRTTCPIASGTGSLTGRLYYVEYYITV